MIGTSKMVGIYRLSYIALANLDFESGLIWNFQERIAKEKKKTRYTHRLSKNLVISN